MMTEEPTISVRISEHSIMCMKRSQVREGETLEEAARRPLSDSITEAGWTLPTVDQMKDPAWQAAAKLGS